MNVWVLFLVSAAIVVFSGIKLSGFANVIAKKSSLGALWVGSILLSVGTSLPEFVAGISAGVLRLPDLAVGNVLGSNIFNILIIAVVDLFDGKRSILRKVKLGHILSGNFGMLLSVIVALAIFVDLPYKIGWVGLDTLLIFLIYLFGLRLISSYESRSAEDQPIVLAEGIADPQGKIETSSDMTLTRAAIGFAVTALVIAGAGTMLTKTSDQIAQITGLGSTFVGTTLLAATTSLPEIVAGLAAVSAGAFDLAIGNVLGSNIFNMVILIASDVAYVEGPILAAVSNTHILTALFGLILSVITVIGLFYRSTRDYLRLGPDSVFIVIVYMLATYFLFTFRG